MGGGYSVTFLKRVSPLSLSKDEVGHFLRRMRSRQDPRFCSVVFSAPGVQTTSAVEGVGTHLNTHAYCG